MRRFFPTLALTLLLAACGGGGGGDSSGASITGLSIRMLADANAPLRYRGTALVTVTGTGLAGASLTFGGTACTLGGTPAGFADSETARYRQCTITGVGAQQVTVAPAGGAIAQTVNIDVPQPQVTVTMASNGSTLGSFVITLDPARTPVTVDNFLAYVAAGFYDGTVIHRHAPNFVLQGGGYASPVTATALPTLKATNAPIALEVGRGLSNLRYTVAMARTNVLDSATSQFFINIVDNTFLDTASGGYAVFGSIGTGTTLVETMRAAPCVAATWLSAGECLPSPNLVIASAVQTR